MITMAGRSLVALIATLLMPFAAHAADDPFIGHWRLSFAASTIADNPGVKSKQFTFTPKAEGVDITETLETTAEPGKMQVSHIFYSYGKLTPQAGPGIDSLLVAKADDRTVYWTATAKGQLAALLQVVVSPDGKRMTFRYLWSAADPAGQRFRDRYVYERE